MSLLTVSEQDKLKDLLVKLPNIALPAVRQNLLSGLPETITLNIISVGIPAIDVAAIVDTVDGEWAQLADGTWPITRVIENAARLVAGQRLATDLRALLDTANSRAGLVSGSRELPEAIIKEAMALLDAEPFLTGMMAAIQTVCRVETPDKTGTGFLVGPDLVITNYHVVDTVIDRPERLAQTVLRFDYRVDAQSRTVSDGKEYLVLADEPLPRSPYEQLDFALLRVKGRPGDDPAGDVGGRKLRGWLRPVARTFRNQELIVIIQHPSGKPLKLAFDGVHSFDERRVRYLTNTEAGSSGSPCLNKELELVALHHAGDKVGGYNQGVPFSAILKSEGVAQAIGI